MSEMNLEAKKAAVLAKYPNAEIVSEDSSGNGYLAAVFEAYSVWCNSDEEAWADAYAKLAKPSPSDTTSDIPAVTPQPNTFA